VHARTAFGGTCASSMPDAALRLLQHYERHTSTIPSNVPILARTMASRPPHVYRCIRLGEFRSEPLGLISMLRITSKQPHPKKRTPVTFTVSSGARARAEQTDEARVKVKSVQFPGQFPG